MSLTPTRPEVLAATAGNVLDVAVASSADKGAEINPDHMDVSSDSLPILAAWLPQC